MSAVDGQVLRELALVHVPGHGEPRIEALRVAHEGRELAFTVSAGLVEVSPDETLVEAIARADRALYQAKGDGRNCVRTAS